MLLVGWYKVLLAGAEEFQIKWNTISQAPTLVTGSFRFAGWGLLLISKKYKNIAKSSRLPQ